jgi:N-acetylmuramic acid 6-phosphate etherase
MKAGTAQKAVLNILSTTTMLRCGLVYRGLMVNMRISNEKLLQRGQAIIRDITGVDAHTAQRSLEEAELEIKLGVLIALGTPKLTALKILSERHNNLRDAIATLPDRTPAHA